MGGPGYASSGLGGTTNDDANAPALPGSGGGCGNANYGGGGAGGGLIRLVVNKIATLKAGSRIEADGAAGRNFTNSDRVGGGGAGGGIYLTCKRFVGEAGATISARGGMSARHTGGGGGGGRIAIWRVTDQSTGPVSTDVTGGMGRSGNADAPADRGLNGTIVWGWLPAPGTVITLR